MEVDLKAYEDFVVRGISPKVPATMELSWASMGLTAELGEFVEVQEKALRKKGQLDDEDYDKMKDELGDVLWYLTATAYTIGTSLEELIFSNTEKLIGRGNK